MDNTDIRFFYSASSPDGFYSLFDELYDAHNGWRAYIIKGGPGTGKSNLLKEVAGELKVNGFEVERVPSSADPFSLDAVVFPEVKVCIADGTSPKGLEPKYPGAIEKIVNLGEYWDENQLREHTQDIISLTLKNSVFHKKCARFLAAASSLRGDVFRLALNCTDEEKIERYAARFAAKEFGCPRGGIGRESRRFLSAVTPIGVDVNYDTARSICSKVFVVEDEYGAASTLLLSQLRRYAMGNGMDVISCICPLDPASGAEHLIIPEIGLGIFTGNSYHRFRFDGSKTIRSSRFTDAQEIRMLRSRIAFSHRAQRELINEAVTALRQAKGVHDELDKIYNTAMDFDAVQVKAKEIAGEILALK